MSSQTHNRSRSIDHLCWSKQVERAKELQRLIKKQNGELNLHKRNNTILHDTTNITYNSLKTPYTYNHSKTNSSILDYLPGKLNPDQDQRSDFSRERKENAGVGKVESLLAGRLSYNVGEKDTYRDG